MRIRPAADGDSEGVIRLIASVYAEYEGCVLDVDGEEPGLRAPASRFERFWVLVDDAGEVAGCVGLATGEGGGGTVVELKKLYLRRDLRRVGWGGRLAGLVEADARRRGAAAVELWSDTRFREAHAFYEARGYRRSGRIRELHDLSATTEVHFRREFEAPPVPAAAPPEPGSFARHGRGRTLPR